MHRRAFVAVETQKKNWDDIEVIKAWGTITIPWPPTCDDLQDAACKVVALKGLTVDTVIITCLTWIGPVIDD